MFLKLSTLAARRTINLRILVVSLYIFALLGPEKPVLESKDLLPSSKYLIAAFNHFYSVDGKISNIGDFFRGVPEKAKRDFIVEPILSVKFTSRL